MGIMKRFLPLGGSLIILLFLIGVTQVSGMKLFIYNSTDSLPHGIYRIHSGAFQQGDLVVFVPPDQAKKIIRDRHYLREGGYLMKYLVGKAGDSIRTCNGQFVVAGANYGEIFSHDKEGRALPHYPFSDQVKEGYIVAVKGHNRSFDSRYFGPIPRASIIGRATPLWLFNDR